MREAMRGTTGLRILALVLAIAAWTYFRAAALRAPVSTVERELHLPIEVISRASNERVSFDLREAVATIITPADGMLPRDVHAVVDLDRRGPGIYILPIQIRSRYMTVHAVSPATITVRIQGA